MQIGSIKIDLNGPNREAFFLEDKSKYLYHFSDGLKDKSLRESSLSLIRLYSLGVETLELFSYYKNLVHQASEAGESLNYADRDQYQLALCLASFVNFGESDFQFDQELEAVLGDTIDDRIVNFLQQGSTKLDYSRQIKYGNPFIFLNNFIENRSPQTIEGFLKNYYASLKSIDLHDSHINDSENFPGYWSFELAAMVKILNESDVGIASHMFYPRDLIGREFLPTWEDSPRGEAARERLTEINQKAVAQKRPEELHRDEIEAVISQYLQEESLSIARDPKIQAKVLELQKNLNLLEKNFEKNHDQIMKFNFDFFTDMKNEQGVFDEESIREIYSQKSEKLQTQLKAKFPDVEEEEWSSILQDLGFSENQWKDSQSESKSLLHTMSTKYLEIHEAHSENPEAYWDQLDVLMNEYDFFQEKNLGESPRDSMKRDLKEKLSQSIDKSSFKPSLNDLLGK